MRSITHVVLAQLAILLASLRNGLATPNSFTPMTFVSPATPIIVQTSKPSSTPDLSTLAKIQAIKTGYGMYTPLSPASQKRSALLSKKKGGGSKKSNKIQVKMLKYVEGTGKIGDVVMVAPAFFENKLKKSGSAVMVTDEEVASNAAEKIAAKEKELKIAEDLKLKLNDFSLSLSKKAGPDGHLFGAIGKKLIFSELQKKFPSTPLNGKQIRIISLTGEDGNDLGKHDIKMIGDYEALIAIQSNINAKIKVIVTAD